jgi:hypothetical protein
MGEKEAAEPALPKILKERVVISSEGAPRAARSESFRFMYADTSRLGYSPWDIRLTFGLLVEETPGEIVNREEVCVILSPSHCKTLQRILNEQMPVWEKQFGEVRDPLSLENLPPDLAAAAKEKANTE